MFMCSDEPEATAGAMSNCGQGVIRGGHVTSTAIGREGRRRAG